MASTTRRTRKPAVTPAKAARTIRASAEKALEAGMQAASGVRQSAVGAFDTLVKQGAALEARSRKAALAKAEKARAAACARAEEARAKTVEAVSHLEKVFEQRVSRTISKLGVPTVRDVRSLSRQVAQLQASVDQLHRTRARAAR
jgi:poly(hydroxyalkanoate) granule-associated protein